MHIFRGISALSDFKKTMLLAKLQAIDPAIKDLTAEFVHLVDAKKLTGRQNKELNTILTYGRQIKKRPAGQLFFVTPRPGTISPWSSKATDIAHSCGLQNVVKIERGIAYFTLSDKKINKKAIISALHDRMTETVFERIEHGAVLFDHAWPRSYNQIDIITEGKKALESANTSQGLALSADEIDYLYVSYLEIGRIPTDIELMMFAQINSEHCRHKIFNAAWKIDGKTQPKSLFQMIKNSHSKSPGDVLSAYSDNAAVFKGPSVDQFFPDTAENIYKYRFEPAHLVAKAETHNHPTAIAPFPGVATGIGGEIRDEAAAGRGARSKMSFSGYSVSNLNIDGLTQPWEQAYGKPERITSPLNIMIDGPLGGSGFANEFGRPNLAGYFRTYQQKHVSEVWGYHKPLMIAGGLGNIRDRYVHKKRIPIGTKIIVLGGPAMLIGLGGGAASSIQSGQSDEDLDFASVQRGNGEMERRAQEVINACWSEDKKNPIISIHDVGAGGLSNALPELVHDSEVGAVFELRDIPNDEPGMSPLEIWCNESQERFVLAVAEKDLDYFADICGRERCLYSVVGTTTEEERLVLTDRNFENRPIDIPMDILFGKPPKMQRQFKRKKLLLRPLATDSMDIDEAVKRVFHLPAVSSKKFLITIGDRTVGGLVVRDQMVGPWQVPVSDVAVSSSSFKGTLGEAMAIGERTPLALVNAPASARIAIGEAITNIAAASINKLSDIKLSANWMAAAGYGQEDQNLFDAVQAVGEDFCPALGIAIPVGKDSLSMRANWQEKNQPKAVTSPLSVIISAFAPVTDASQTLTPELTLGKKTELIYIDLGRGKNRLGGSALAQVYNQVGSVAPDVKPELLKNFFEAIQKLKKSGKLLAYHDRSDGGLITALSEMAFASRCGLKIDLTNLPGKSLDQLFSEELGAVIQVSLNDKADVLKQLQNALSSNIYAVGQPTKKQEIIFSSHGKTVYSGSRSRLESWWAETSYHIQKLRDNPRLAKQEYEQIKDETDPGVKAKFNFLISSENYQTRPKVAIFREQGVNGQVEMAAAFDMAGFETIDVHLSDLASSRKSLDDFSILAACGGFSYGDVLGAGEGWAKSILFNKALRKQFLSFFSRPDTLSLGVCNGCQMLGSLKDLIPGAGHWPKFQQNESGRFEARLVNVKINDTSSVFFKNMSGAILPLPVAHGEGRADFKDDKAADVILKKKLAPLQYVDNYGRIARLYPSNPNGSSKGITCLTSVDGRAAILMPHPERVFLTKQLSWHPDGWGEESPWLQIFNNARKWVEKNS